MFNESILKPQSMCPYTSLEDRLQTGFGDTVKAFKCRVTKRVRFIAFTDDGSAVCGLIVEPQGKIFEILGVFTREDQRRKGFAKQLLCVSRLVLGVVKHSDHLTEEGAKWAKKVENI